MKLRGIYDDGGMGASEKQGKKATKGDDVQAQDCSHGLGLAGAAW